MEQLMEIMYLRKKSYLQSQLSDGDSYNVIHV